MTNRLELNWKLDGFVEEQRYYCSETPIDVNELPAAKAILSADVRTYLDNTIEIGKKYYLRIGSVKNGFEKISDEVEFYAQEKDPYWEYVTDLMHFDGNLNNEAGSNWTGTSPTYEAGVFGQSARISSPLNKANSIGNKDFTIEFFYKSVNYTSSSYPAILTFGSTWATGALSLNARRSNTGNVVSLYTFDANYFVTTTNINTGTFIHLALECFNGILTLYVEGNSIGSLPFSSVTLSNKIFLGSTGQNAITMLIDEFRITTGVARYRGNFTPPAEPFTNL